MHAVPRVGVPGPDLKIFCSALQPLTTLRILEVNGIEEAGAPAAAL